MKLYLISLIGFSLILNLPAIDFTHKMDFSSKASFGIKNTYFMNFCATKNPALSTQTQTALALLDLKRQADAQKAQTNSLATQIYRQNKVVPDIIRKTLLEKILLQENVLEQVKEEKKKTQKDLPLKQKIPNVPEKKTPLQKKAEKRNKKPITLDQKNAVSITTPIAKDHPRSPLKGILKDTNAPKTEKKQNKFLRFSTTAKFKRGNFEGIENSIFDFEKTQDAKKRKKNKSKKARQHREAQKALTCPRAADILLCKLIEHKKYQQKISDILIREGLVLPRPSKKTNTKTKKVTNKSPLKI